MTFPSICQGLLSRKSSNMFVQLCISEVQALACPCASCHKTLWDTIITLYGSHVQIAMPKVWHKIHYHEFGLQSLMNSAYFSSTYVALVRKPTWTHAAICLNLSFHLSQQLMRLVSKKWLLTILANHWTWPACTAQFNIVQFKLMKQVFKIYNTLWFTSNVV
jgi:hypothetical protein